MNGNGIDMSNASLKRGDWVEVLPPAAILATLDASGRCDGLLFMPEMVPLCGRRFRVERRTERVCDTVTYRGSRRLADAVVLDDLRCDGSGHDGCQADCRFAWKEAWLRRVEPAAPASAAYPAEDARRLLERASAQTRRSVATPEGPQTRWRCQTTELLAATTPIEGLNLRSLLHEYRCGNVRLGYFLRVLARALLWEPMRKRTLLTSTGLLRGAASDPKQAFAPPAPLDLRPGEWVRVKSRAEIAATLAPDGHNRGLSFDREMLRFCGGRYRVRHRVTRLIDEGNGRMLRIGGDCIALEKVACAGECSARRLFCPRAVRPFWRECWLERIEALPLPKTHGAGVLEGEPVLSAKRGSMTA